MHAADARPRANPSERLATLERTMDSRESLKNVSLGTSKINYLDPRYAPRVRWVPGAAADGEHARTQHLRRVVQAPRRAHREDLHQSAAREIRGACSPAGRVLRACILTPCLRAARGPWRWSRTLTFELDVFQ